MNEEEVLDEPTRQRQLLIRLGHYEEFHLWRELVADPVIAQIESQLQQPLELDEIKLKSLLMYRNLVKAMFHDLFSSLEIQKELEEINGEEN